MQTGKMHRGRSHGSIADLHSVEDNSKLRLLLAEDNAINMKVRLQSWWGAAGAQRGAGCRSLHTSGMYGGGEGQLVQSSYRAVSAATGVPYPVVGRPRPPQNHFNGQGCPGHAWP